MLHCVENIYQAISSGLYKLMVCIFHENALSFAAVMRYLHFSQHCIIIL